MGGGAKYVEKEEVQIGDSDTCISISNDFFLFVSLTDNLNFVFFLPSPLYSIAILREITTCRDNCILSTFSMVYCICIICSLSIFIYIYL